MNDPERFFTRQSSEAIRVSRVLCITLMMFVHVWPYSALLDASLSPIAHASYSLLINEFARASVPLLSIVSGLLFFRTTLRKRWSTIVSNKVQSLLVPMILWCSVSLVLQMTHEILRAEDLRFFNVSLLDWVNRLFALTAAPANLPLAFLRDVFVCAAIGLVAKVLDSRQRFASTAFFLVLAATEFSEVTHLLLRPQILVFFAIGYTTALANPRSLVLPWAVVLASIAADAIVRMQVYDFSLANDSPADIFHRLSVAGLMWRCAIAVVNRGGPIKSIIFELEPFIFLVFCSHEVTIELLSVLLNKSGISATDTIFPLVYFGQIPVVFAVAWAIQRVASAFAPGTLNLLDGGSGQATRNRNTGEDDHAGKPTSA